MPLVTRLLPYIRNLKGSTAPPRGFNNHSNQLPVAVTKCEVMREAHYGTASKCCQLWLKLVAVFHVLVRP